MMNYQRLGSPRYSQCWYHKHCNDGFVAALIAWRFFKNTGRELKFEAVQYGQEPPPTTPDDYVLIVDFSFKKDVTEKLLASVAGLVILDHHATAYDELKHLDPHIFQFCREKSGAVMTWEHFKEERVPELVRYVQDRDLWRFEMRSSKEVSAALSSYPYLFEVWDNLFFGRNRTDINTLIGKGRSILAYKDQLAETAAKSARLWRVGGHPGYVVNSTVLFSEIGDYLLRHRDENTCQFAACYFVKDEGKVVFSLRSRKDFDATTIAKQFGGGGHAQACGFELPIEEFVKLYEVNNGQKV